VTSVLIDVWVGFNIASVLFLRDKAVGSGEQELAGGGWVGYVILHDMAL
jgi:hypothetical protein